jgi:hypothetical protein
MRISERKTPAAVLRFILGEKLDDDFCNLVGCSRDLWRKLENGDRRMTERTAAQVEAATGASRVWLLTGNPKAKPVAVDGQPFTLQYFREFQAAQISGDNRPLAIAVYPCGHLPSLMATAASAVASGRLAAFAVELEAAVIALRRKFGVVPEAVNETLQAMQRAPGAFLFEATDATDERDGDRQARHNMVEKQIATGLAPWVVHMQTKATGKSRSVEMKAHGVRPFGVEVARAASGGIKQKPQTPPRSRGRKAKP